MVSNNNASHILPSQGYALIEPLEAETQTSFGIYLPESNTEKPQKGKVLAIGLLLLTEDGRLISAPCKVGDVVYYKKWTSNEIKIDGKEYLFTKFEDILGIDKKGEKWPESN